MKYSIDWLKEELSNGSHHEYFFFWGHSQKQKGVIDKSCFSQWFPSPFIANGIVYPTAEHWIMAKKAELFGDKEILEEILKVEKPAIAKELGRKIENFDAEKWNASSYDIVVEGNKHKFLQNGALKTFLLHTGNKIIAEASPSDAIWGIGLSQNDSEGSNPFKWKGTNLLGFALMEVRDYLKQENGKGT
jgi:ribA/ribD-fused uncharacterized protein